MSNERKQTLALTYAAFVAGLCSIVYELLIATTVSYFLGDSVKYFSLTIGMYMAAMGAGSYCSKFIGKNLVSRFLKFEIALAGLGGLSIPLLYLTYIHQDLFIPTYVVLTCSIGFLIGLEIPFLTRLMEDFKSLKSNIASVLTFDYIGALIATIAFPFFLLPVLGNYQSSLVLGLINLTIIAVLMRYFSKDLGKAKKRIFAGLFAMASILVAAIIFANQALYEWDQALFDDQIVHAEQTRYQKIVVTKNSDDVRLYLNGNIQFSSIDEYRYHEALISYPMLYKKGPVKRVLLLGAGDGLAVRQLLNYPEIEAIVLVDLDQRVVELAKTNPYLRDLNQDSLLDPKLEIVHSDAYTYLQDNYTQIEAHANTQTMSVEQVNSEHYSDEVASLKSIKFDLIISDLPDPNTIELARLYTKQFYRTLKANLNEDGVFVTQSTSPYFATKAFWSIHNTLVASGFEHVIPYHADVPSFGDWGFVMASNSELNEKSERDIFTQSQFLHAGMLDSMRIFAKDQAALDVDINSIDKPVLLHYYLEGWQKFGY
ncbi:polyamine aminopropyltransferase [Glaciecola petra]|uniref:Polyamine aminopropyltransferase n=1 Tax=Glaciecola petra TaxID=3075602 RepID=A0ABU2ZYH3_9ALTE|nr:polyamine aminopropyltransferase [Aestuariibacter sp. P117]MDT0596644.1 polyamine aminopropyltransferase [Aestuariibacter sp. P117]